MTNTTNQLDRVLAATLEDHRLSRSERRALADVFAEATSDESERRQLRNRAFHLAAAELEQREAQLVLDWLHDVVKTLDNVALPIRPATFEQAFFSPGPEPSSRIVRLIEETSTELDICVFTITDNAISSALLAAHGRGVKMRLVTDDDKAHDRGSDVGRLTEAGIAVRQDRSDAHMHHKYAIADRRLLLTGSYNWTRSAGAENEENILITGSETLVRRFGENFEALWRRLG